MLESECNANNREFLARTHAIMSHSPSQRFLPRFSGLRSRIYLSVLLLAAAFAIIAAAGWIDAGQQVRSRLQSQVENGLGSFQSDFDRATLDLAGLGNTLVTQPEFVDLVQTRDGAGLNLYLAPWTQVSLADSITVSDKDGLVLSRLAAGQPITQGENLKDDLGIAQALSGSKSTSIVRDAAGRLEHRLILPVYSTQGKTPVGALMLAFYLDGNFLQYRSRKPDEEIAVIFQDRLTVLTLTDAEGKTWGGQLAPAAVLAAQQTNTTSDFMTLQLDVGSYLFKFKPLEITSGGRGPMYGVGVSLATLDSDQLRLFRVFLVGLSILAVGTGLVGFWFARGLTHPIQALGRAAHAMSRGDLTQAVALPRNDELGDLAKQMDWMRQQLSVAFQSATLEKSRLAAVIQSIGVATLISDVQLKILAANPAAEGLLGRKEDGLLGESWHDLFLMNGANGDSPSGTWTLGEAEVGGGNSLVVHGRFGLRSRPHLTLDVVSSPVQIEGKPAGYVHVLTNATAYEQLVRAQDEFIMNTAHELRSPLASLRASVEVLVEDYANMDRQELGFMLKTMQRGILRFQTLVENLIDVGTVQARRFRVYPTPVSVGKLIEGALAQIEPLLQARAQSATVEMECPAGSLVLADRPRIAQVLINLLSNASKYGPEGEPIILNASCKDGFVVIQVTDRGPGIPPDEQGRLFERFYRGRRAEEGIGIGLGLALAREIVQAHGGQIDVRSQVGAGTTFWFSLPEAESNEADENVILEAVTPH